MSIPPVGTKVKWKQPTEGVISEVKPHYFFVKFKGPDPVEWSFELEQINEFDIEYPEPQAGEVWVHENGTRAFLWFNSLDILCAVTTHGQALSSGSISVPNGWSRVL